MTAKQFRIEKKKNGKYAFFEPCGLYNNKSADELVGILIKYLNDYYESREKVEEDYLEFSLIVKRVLEAELDKSDIPVWKHGFIRELAYNMGVDL